MNMKRSLLIGVSVASAGLAGVGGVGVASAMTQTDTNSTSIVEKIASKFNLNKDEVQKVFDEVHEERHAEMQERQQERLTQAVTDGKLTQEQADHITAATKEISELMQQAKSSDTNETVRAEVREKVAALRDWAKENDVDMKYIGHGGRGGHHGGMNTDTTTES